MFCLVIQVKEILSSNVTSVLDGVTDPVKMLRQLQREIEEAIIALQGELTRARWRHERLDAASRPSCERPTGATRPTLR